VSEADALNYVLGYTCGNDIGMMDVLQKDNKLITRAKGFDMSSALGPWLETALDPSNLDIKGIINGQVIQDSNTKEMLFSAAFIVSYISEFMTLRPAMSSSPAHRKRPLPGQGRGRDGSRYPGHRQAHYAHRAQGLASQAALEHTQAKGRGKRPDPLLWQSLTVTASTSSPWPSSTDAPEAPLR
jgi:hypothetical protein